MSTEANNLNLDKTDQLFIDTLRMLSVDQVEAANSGHPGLPLGMAPVAYAIFSRFLKFDPEWPKWPDRDRFVLSAGHGSALLYSLLHLFGYPLPIEELKRFRQWGSQTPGHPEFGHTAGVEVTTGPLGQGIATAVGLALAERMLAARANKGGLAKVVDHRTFVLASDGDLMEGISHEAASLAGHLGLGRLIVCFDDNNVTIDGPADQSCSDDVLGRFAAYGWHTDSVDDANNLERVVSSLQSAVAQETRPSLIAIRSVIGYGSPNKAGTSAAHGSALGKDEARATKEFFGWPTDEPFHIPEAVRVRSKEIVTRARSASAEWLRISEAQGFSIPDQTVEEGGYEGLVEFEVGTSLATRVASTHNLVGLLESVQTLVGGSADLAESTGTKVSAPKVSKEDFTGKIINFGIREHAMAACSNGLALHGGFRPFCSTFLVFSDYLRPSLRLSALMGLPVIYLFTHDSIAVGEDGPTHQPIEQVAALRAIPNLAVVRPGDPNETSEAWRLALSRTDGPTALILTRQALATIAAGPTGWVSQFGARIVYGSDNTDATIVASGSEVGLAIAAAKHLSADHSIGARVVSIPWRERFLSLDQSVQDEILGPTPYRIAIEAGIPLGWDALVAPAGKVIAISNFGASAPGPIVLDNYGFSVDKVVEEVLSIASGGIFSDQANSSPLSSLIGPLLSATQRAAIMCQPYVGLGEKELADQAAVTAMRTALQSVHADITVAIGEGEKDKAPMLYVGERLGDATGASFEIAVDPLEGTNYCAKGQDGAVAVLAASSQGSIYPTSGFYMEKLIVSAKARDAIDITQSASKNLEAIAEALGKTPADLKVVVLAKPRHQALISEIRSFGARVVEIPDGDVMASLKVMLGGSGLDVLMGTGGAPEGVISACAARILGSGMQARLAPQSESERAMLDEKEPGWMDRVLKPEDMVKADSVVIATAVTSSDPLSGPRLLVEGWETESVVIADGTARYVKGITALQVLSEDGGRSIENAREERK